MEIGHSMCLRLQYTDFSYMGCTGPREPIKMIFGSHIQSWYTSLNIKFGVNRMSDVSKISVYRFLYMGGTGPCGPIMIIFGS